jgi:predicted lipid-binding transport protein (Tim44 family)
VWLIRTCPLGDEAAMNRLAPTAGIAEMGGMAILESGALVYLIAGIAVGIALTMLIFSLTVAFDRMRLRRRIRRARAAASMLSAPEPAMPSVRAATMLPLSAPPPAAASAEPSPVVDPPDDPPERRTPTVEELFAEAFRAQAPGRPGPGSDHGR